jgi:hypothetical protein
MATIHHNTLKRAARFGITLVPIDNGMFSATNGSAVELSRGDSPKVVLEEAICQVDPSQRKTERKPRVAKPKKAKAKRRVEDDEESDEDADELDAEEERIDDEVEEDEEEDKEVVKKKYRERYKPFKMTCGDDLAKQITQHVSRQNDDGELRIDPVKLRTFARANDCWDPRYSGLNVGMQRMNVANRLRAKVRKGHKVRW